MNVNMNVDGCMNGLLNNCRQKSDRVANACGGGSDRQRRAVPMSPSLSQCIVRFGDDKGWRRGGLVCPHLRRGSGSPLDGSRLAG